MKPPLNHMMLHEDTLADEFEAILGYRTSHEGIVLPGGFESTGNKMLVIGDSIAGQHTYTFGAATAPTAVTTYGTTTMRITKSGHGVVVGCEVYGFRCTDEDLNGRFTVTNIVDADNFEVELPSAKGAGSATAKTGDFAYHRQQLLDDRGSINWLTSLNGACFDIVGVHAEGASTTSYLSTLVANSAGTDYDWVTIISGINDAAGWSSTPADGSAEALVANITAVADALRAAGKGVIISTIGPWGAAHASYSADRYTEVKVANALLRDYAAGDPGVFIMDTMAAGSADVDGVPVANMLSDNLHPTPKGAYTYAKQFMADNPGILPDATALLPLTAADDINVTPATLQHWRNPMFSGTGGLKTSLSAHTAPTGTVADYQTLSNFGATMTSVGSIVAGNSGVGSAQRIDATFTANNDGLYLRPTDNLADVVVGEYMRVACRVQMSATGGGVTTQVGRCMAYLQASWGSTRFLAAILYNASQPAAAQYPQLDETEPLTLVTPKHILTTRTSLSVLQPWWQGNVKGSATNTYDVERPALWASST